MTVGPHLRLAFVTSLVPGRVPSSGFEIANRGVVDGLRALGHDVTAIGWKLPETKAEEGARTQLLGEAELRNANVGMGTKLRWVARAYATGLPFAAAKLRALPDPRIDLEPFDAVVFNSWQMAAAFPALRAQRPWAYLSHNVEHATAAENAVHSRSRFEGHLHARDARLLRDLERELVRDARFVWTLSEDDRAAFGLDAKRSAALPLVFPAADPTSNGTPAFDATMIGTFTWEPNAVGLRWLLDEVLPRLDPAFRLAIAGSVPPDLRREDPRVTWMGRVDDANAFMRQGAFVPLVARGGTGVQLKSIEAFQLGMAAVATSSSLRGVGEVPSNVSRCDDPLDFARAMTELTLRAREGEDLRVDPAAFVASQRAGLLAGLKRGIDRLAAR